MAPYYNYYELAVQRWCTDGYQIHGLWPQINATDYPSYCEDVSYSPPSGALFDAMKENWNECGTLPNNVPIAARRLPHRFYVARQRSHVNIAAW